MAIKKTNVVEIKRILYVCIPTLMCMYILSNLNAKGKDIATERLNARFSLTRDNKVNDSETLRKFGLPAHYFHSDFIADNHLVDKLSPKLKTNLGVIDEATKNTVENVQSSHWKVQICNAV